MTNGYQEQAPTRAETDALPDATVLDFGTDWCSHCRAAQPYITRALARYPGLRHIRIEDGSGRSLGRSYRVKLWPTLIFLKDGQELARVVRPTDAAPIAEALTKITA
jgi:thioredoxin 1